MSLSSEELKYLSAAHSLSDIEKSYLEAVMDGVQDHANDRGIKAVGDDRCARLESAVIRYILESKEIA
jgi:hypothetical protein